MRLLLLSLSVVLLSGCKSGDTAKSENSIFRVWGPDSGTTTLDLSGKYIGWKNQFIASGCTYEIRIEGTTAEFTKKTVDITNPVDPSCFDYSSDDLVYYYVGTALRVCFVSGAPLSGTSTDGCEHYH